MGTSFLINDQRPVVAALQSLRPRSTPGAPAVSASLMLSGAVRLQEMWREDPHHLILWLELQGSINCASASLNRPIGRR